MPACTAARGRTLMTAFTLTVAFLNKQHSSFVRGFTHPSRPLYVTRRLLSAGQGDGWGADGGLRDSGSPAVPPEGMAEHMAAVEKFQMEVLYEDEHIVAVNKPPGLLCVAGVFAGKKDSLAALVAQQFRHRDVARTVVHRLDQGTSGVVCFARTEVALKELHAQFRDKDVVQKRYTAMVYGLMEHDEGRIELPLRKDMDNPPKQMVDMELGKPSLTRFRVRERGRAATHVDLIPVTGRTHQLRVHVSALGHPVLGDPFYAHAEARAMAPRLLLHAMELRIRHPTTGQKLKFQSPCPFTMPE